MGTTQQQILQEAGISHDEDLALWTSECTEEDESSAIELQIYTPEPSPVNPLKILVIRDSSIS